MLPSGHQEKTVFLTSAGECSSLEVQFLPKTSFYLLFALTKLRKAKAYSSVLIQCVNNINELETIVYDTYLKINVLNFYKYKLFALSRETMTSPNGNHYVTPIDSSCSDTEEEVTSPDRKCEDILFQPKSSGHKIKPFSKDTKLKTSRDNFTDYHGSFRITKNGDYFPVATTEQHLNRFQRTSTMDDDEIAMSSMGMLEISSPKTTHI